MGIEIFYLPHHYNSQGASSILFLTQFLVCGWSGGEGKTSSVDMECQVALGEVADSEPGCCL